MSSSSIVEEYTQSFGVVSRPRHSFRGSSDLETIRLISALTDGYDSSRNAICGWRRAGHAREHTTIDMSKDIGKPVPNERSTYAEGHRTGGPLLAPWLLGCKGGYGACAYPEGLSRITDLRCNRCSRRQTLASLVGDRPTIDRTMDEVNRVLVIGAEFVTRMRHGGKPPFVGPC